MVGNEKQKICLIQENGEYIGYDDNEDVQDLLNQGWIIKGISGASTNSTPRCYVFLEKPNNIEAEEIAK